MAPFWIEANDASVEAKRQYRFLMLNGNIPQWIVKKVTKPEFTVSESTHHYINHTFYYPGKVEWNKITLTLVDPVAPDAAATMYAILESSGYHPPSNENDVSTISKAKARAALGDIKIQQIDHDGKAVETWSLVNAWVTSAKFGELSYEGDDLTNVELEIRYDFAYVDTVGGASGPSDMIGKKHFPTTWQ